MVPKNIHTPLDGRLLKILKRRGVFKTQLFIEKYNFILFFKTLGLAKLKFAEGWGLRVKKSFHRGKYGYFLEEHILTEKKQVAI